MLDGPLHPGLHVALARGQMDEAQVARAMAAGELTSPQHYGNSWLFNVRITGTGASFRKALDEYVWRDPSLYLNQGFLDRCYGLPVIIEHPKAEMLDSKEFAKRVIGSILYPYIREEVKEVWGIARILDMASAQFMRERQLSTSPCVVFRNPDAVNDKIDIGDGKHLLIEGKPSLLDHLAICEEGVWDKGGPPAGVDVTGEKESSMPEKRTDASNDKLDRVLSAVLAVVNRVDSLETRMNGSTALGRSDAATDEAAQAAEMRELVDELTELAEEEEDEAEMQLHQEAADKKDSKKDGEKDESKKDKKKADASEDKDEDEDKAKKDEAEDEDDKDKKKADAEDEPDEDKAKKDDDGESADDSAKKDEAEDEKDKKDTRSDTSEDEDMARGDNEMPWDKAKRAKGESDAQYAGRADGIARQHDPRFVKRADESTAAYCDRLDTAFLRYKARSDAVRRLNKVDLIADAVVKVAGRLDSLSKRFDAADRDLPAATEAAFADAQARADEVFLALGDSAPRPMRGEDLLAYRLRLARKLQVHSSVWKERDLATIARADAGAFENIESMVYADAAMAARQPSQVEPGLLREVKRRRQGGGEISEFVGNPITWMQSFMAPARCATRLRARPQA